ncbi:hypothetical protein [Candidatus Palauibacter sp.]|uniref:hypothetical protein n=1 Tax=Candidatus Palauibacter sp. TaxID=3101350 RepID=UPI003C7053A9
MKAVAKGSRGGGSTKAIIFGAVGAFFCTDVYDSYWEWRDSDNGMQDMSGLLDSKSIGGHSRVDGGTAYITLPQGAEKNVDSEPPSLRRPGHAK